MQARQEAMAAAQRENNRWQADDLINKYYKMREDARAEEEVSGSWAEAGVAGAG